jgi:hypothetical protein
MPSPAGRCLAIGRRQRIVVKRVLADAIRLLRQATRNGAQLTFPRRRTGRHPDVAAGRQTIRERRSGGWGRRAHVGGDWIDGSPPFTQCGHDHARLGCVHQRDQAAWRSPMLLPRTRSRSRGIDSVTSLLRHSPLAVEGARVRVCRRQAVFVRTTRSTSQLSTWSSASS